MVDLVVGAPVRAREWILRPWFLAVEAAAEVAGMVPTYAFVIDVRDRSEALLQDLCAERGREIRVCHVNEDGNLTDVRDWNESRYHHMVWLRNHLLTVVRELEPLWFLSLDTDILLAPTVLANLVDTAARYDAVGGKCFLAPRGTSCPNYANLINVNGLLRDDTDQVVPVDVIMAIKLLGPEAYGVDYEFHFHGEDIGFCKALTAKGLTIGFDGRVTSKHCMSPADLDAIDVRCGF